MQAPGDHPIQCPQVMEHFEMRWTMPTVRLHKQNEDQMENRFRQIHGHFPVCVCGFFELCLIIF